MNIIEFAPIVILILIFFLQNKFFVTPQELEKKHNAILKDVENRYMTIFSANEMKEQLHEIKAKIDKIYDFFIQNQ